MRPKIARSKCRYLGRRQSQKSSWCGRLTCGSCAEKSWSGSFCPHARACLTIAAPRWGSRPKSRFAFSSWTSGTKSSLTRCNSRASWTTHRSMCVKWSNERWNSPRPPSYWSTITRAAIRRPPPADIDMTKQIVASAKPMGIVIHDHVIFGKQGHASFKGLGLI